MARANLDVTSTELNEIVGKGTRTNTGHQQSVFVRAVYFPSSCYYSGSHAKTVAGLPLSVSKSWAGGQNDSGGVNVQRQLKVTLK